MEPTNPNPNQETESPEPSEDIDLKATLEALLVRLSADDDGSASEHITEVIDEGKAALAVLWSAFTTDDGPTKLRDAILETLDLDK